MIIGVPKEIKEDEYRVSLLPSTAKKLRERGHQVLIEKNAGVGSGIKDEEYLKSGAEISDSGAEIFKRAELVVKVKEPQEKECPLLQEGQILFTFFHFASSRRLTEAMIKSKIIALAYEMVQKDDGSLPLLAP
ncbi:MAG: alanine dehydrogenase, partial [Candidatus Omnitrophica bacterium]|nr:alanine dehydrogenase [Candidatus Omnitrophota bacterium]